MICTYCDFFIVYCYLKVVEDRHYTTMVFRNLETVIAQRGETEVSQPLYNTVIKILESKEHWSR